MRHGWTKLPTLIALGLGLGGFTRSAHGGDPTDGRLGVRTVPILLLIRSDIQTDLKLSPEQAAECHRAARVFQLKASRLIGRKDPAVVSARREIDEELTQWLTQRLSAKQFGRFEQVDLQWEGAAAMLNRPFLDESLKLTVDQKKQVGDYLAESKLQRAGGAWTYDDHINLSRKAIAVLTDTQRNLWIRLIGPPCHFAIAVNAKPATGQPAASVARNPSSLPR